MFFHNLGVLLATAAILSSFARSQSMSELHGTWSSKSNQVFTGPGFYDPVDELLIEPSLPGISYSFTEDGFFESAIYKVSGNPRDPKCPSATLTFQHGKYELLQNGSLVLTPFESDGRQLVSDPCKDGKRSSYNRYSQPELFVRFQVQVDAYHGKLSLQLYQFDGSPMQPLYLAFKPPQMLPTITLNPTNVKEHAESTDAHHEKRSLGDLVKRRLENKHKTNAGRTQSLFDSGFYWWCGATLIGIGTITFFAV